MDINYTEKLSELINDSRLKEDEKLLWKLFLKMADEGEDEAIYEAAIESEENLILLTKHLRDKIWDMKERNQHAWDVLISDESQAAALF